MPVTDPDMTHPCSTLRTGRNQTPKTRPTRSWADYVHSVVAIELLRISEGNDASLVTCLLPETVPHSASS